MELETRYATLSYNTNHSLSPEFSIFAPAAAWTYLFRIENIKELCQLADR